LVPDGYDGTFKITSATPTDFTYALTTNPGTATLNGATVAPAARAYTVLFNTAMDAVTLTTGSSDDSVRVINDPAVAALTIYTGNGSNLVNVLDVLAPGLTPGPQSITVITGTGSDQVSIYAGQPNHTFNVSTGSGPATADLVVLDGNPNVDGNDTF